MAEWKKRNQCKRTAYSLESKQDFSNWIKNRIKDYGFEEGHDYEVLLPKMEEQNQRGEHNKIKYALSIVEKTKKAGRCKRSF
ncbi:MAG: antA/AntB antirepressor family protein [Bacteroidota bacterium]|nr:antA/AntB antirepressor family protein [Bacteroidota bacterium]